MTAFTLPVVIGTSALAFAAWQSKHANSPMAPAQPVPQVRPSMAATSSIPVGTKAAMTLGGGIKTGVKGLTTIGGTGAAIPKSVGVLLRSGNDAEAVARQKLRELEARAKQAYEDMEEVARVRGAATVNGYLNPSPGLTGHETWAEAGAKIGASVGAIVGAAACGAIPGVGVILASTVCITLGALVFGYLGDKLGAWARDAYNDVKLWVEDKWSDAADAVTSAASDAYDYVSDLF